MTAPPARSAASSRWGVVARALVVAFGALPLVAWALSAVPALAPLAEPLHRWFRFQCHQDPARTAHWLGVALPACWRCLGIYLGVGLGGLVLRPRWSPWALRGMVAAGVALMLLDVGTELAGLRPPSAALRALTGLALAYPVGVALVLAARGE